MIKLTSLFYKIKNEALERFHNINQYSEDLLHEWEKQVEENKNFNIDLPPKPFIEPFEFEEEDYDIKEQKFRIDPKQILLYKENTEGYTELVLSETLSFTIKESVEEIDTMLGI